MIVSKSKRLHEAILKGYRKRKAGFWGCAIGSQKETRMTDVATNHLVPGRRHFIPLNRDINRVPDDTEQISDKIPHHFGSKFMQYYCFA